MEDVKYYLKDPFIPGRGARVITKDQTGKPTGEYKAYYRPERGVATLYPAHGSWIYGGYLPKYEISINLLIKDY